MVIEEEDHHIAHTPVGKEQEQVVVPDVEVEEPL